MKELLSELQASAVYADSGGTETYMNTREAEAYCGLKNLAKRRVEGTSPPYIKCGARVIYSRRAIDEWLAARTRKSTSEYSGQQALVAA